MAKKRRLLGSAHQHNKRARGPGPDRATEIAARRVEEKAEIARSTAEMTAMWESEEWNIAMDAVLKETSPGPPLFSDFFAKHLPASEIPADDDASMDLGWNDDASDSDVEDVEQHWSERPIVCHRSIASEPILREWANLNMLAGTSKEMGPGQRRSILDDRVQQDAYRWHALKMGRPSRPPSNKRTAKIKLFTMHEEFGTGSAADLEDELDSELMGHLIKRAHILRYKAFQARGVRENERTAGLLRSQDARVRRRLSELV